MTRQNPKTAQTRKQRLQEAEKRIEAEFDRRMEILKHAETGARIEAVMEARGRSRMRPIAGDSF